MATATVNRTRRVAQQYLLPACLSAALVAPAQAQPGETLQVTGRNLFDRCGEQVVLRGVNKMTVWTDRSASSFAQIRQTGANSVRIVWTVADHGSDAALTSVLQTAVDNQLLPMIELHDATGELDLVPAMVDFWVRPEIVQILQAHKQQLLLNIANEAGGVGVRPDDFTAVYAEAITRLRAAGYTVPLVIDAPLWGQDIDVLQAAGPALIEADPLKNMLFSVHTWWPAEAGSSDPGSAARIVAELQESVDMELPLVVGEFAYYGVECAEFIDHRALLAAAQTHQIGWLAWSWGPGNSDCDLMDMTTDGNFNTLSGWGLEVATTDPYSIANTAVTPRSLLTGSCDPNAPLLGAEPAAAGAPAVLGSAGAGAVPSVASEAGAPATASSASSDSGGGCRVSPGPRRGGGLVAWGLFAALALFGRRRLANGA